MKDKHKYLLIAGCSHTAGAEIDGTPDSYYNRSKSYGNLLANMLSRTPINIAVCSSSNTGICRSVQEWFYTEYDPSSMDVGVLVGWTESCRIEHPTNNDTWDYLQHHEYADWLASTLYRYLVITMAWPGGSKKEKKIVKGYQKFVTNHLEFFEMYSANIVLQLQYFLKSKDVPYLMCNTMEMFTNSPCNDFYIEMIDKSRYFNLTDVSRSFYPYYKKLGFVNKKANYWHHGEDPHFLYAEDLYKFSTESNLF